MVKTIYVSICFLIFVAPVTAVELDFPIYDYPYNQEAGYRAPSMTQSIEFSKNLYRFAHKAINEKIDNPGKASLFNIGFDLLSTWLPFGSSWLHEEWHRAVMGRRNIDSYNEVYELELFSETIAVTDIRDEDLIALKTNYPAEIVRLHAAGLEAQTELNYSMERDHFFTTKNSSDNLVLWLNYLNNLGYLYTCASNDSDSITQEFYPEEGANISARDFTGLDCNAWVYDLFRPNEPYTARGPHPSGVGIDRYITYSELNPEEKAYLERNVRFSLLNFVNPFLIGRTHFKSKHILWNFSLRHHLTSFGYNLGANVFLKVRQHQLIVTANYQRNRSTSFPGVELRWHKPRLSLPYGQLDEIRFALWTQPESQSFYTDKAEWGGMFSIRGSKKVSTSLRAYVQLSAKTAGWLAGNVYLDEQIGLIGGVEWSVWK